MATLRPTSESGQSVRWTPRRFEMTPVPATSTVTTMAPAPSPRRGNVSISKTSTPRDFAERPSRKLPPLPLGRTLTPATPRGLAAMSNREANHNEATRSLSNRGARWRLSTLDGSLADESSTPLDDLPAPPPALPQRPLRSARRTPRHGAVSSNHPAVGRRRERGFAEKCMLQMQRPEVILFAVWWIILFVVTVYIADLAHHLRAIWRPLLLLVSIPVLANVALCVLTL
eukprot:TRINITY_DN34870_c0_g1_i1.p1 TRINITY_DN34870_c0_g1~~TRINITY_DN34870_c0_g1_i1.p1  ORF type:complete len:229 (-),score=19.04 TRINITY_DN34870_c0_g1_i1:39-725(-)